MESLKEKLQSKCIHFNGIMNDACKLGIKYKDVRVDKPYKFPCIKTGGFCEKCEFRTEEEVEKELKEINDALDKTIGVYLKIKAIDAIQGNVDCECGGIVKFVKAQSNGHIWCKCNKCDLFFNE